MKHNGFREVACTALGSLDCLESFAIEYETQLAAIILHASLSSRGVRMVLDTVILHLQYDTRAQIHLLNTVHSLRLKSLGCTTC